MSRKTAAIVFCTTFVFLLVIIYILIPSQVMINNAVTVNVNALGSCRIVDKWERAFAQKTSNGFVNGDCVYKQTQLYSNGCSFSILYKNQTYQATLYLIPVSPEKSLFEWNANVTLTSNPFEKPRAYINTKKLENNLQSTVKILETYLQNDSNIYRHSIKHTTLTDSILISEKKVFSRYPSTKDVYAMINELQEYTAIYTAQQTNFPMLNISQKGSNYIAMVALPVNKPLPSTDRFYPKRLAQMKDKILTTEVKGGTASVQNAYRQIENYMVDHSLASPVIPFEQLITNRHLEPDTAKWITRIYYPII